MYPSLFWYHTKVKHYSYFSLCKITTLEKEVKEKEAQAENMEERLSKIESLFNDVDKLSDDDIFNLFARKND